MHQLSHLSKQRDVLTHRWHILRGIREWFWQANFVEVEAPTIVPAPGMEPNIAAVPAVLTDYTGKQVQGYLHTSPEYAMKKYLATGGGNIFYLGKVFRDHESFGGTHNPEFTMIEWYRTGTDFYTIMDDVEHLTTFLSTKILSKQTEAHRFTRMHMRDVWKKYIDVNLDEYLDTETMRTLCIDRGYNPSKEESYEELFYRIFLNEIEPNLPELGNVIIHHYPAPMAALSKLSTKEPGYAERFEVYMNGTEIANAFTELTDGAEQRVRLEGEQQDRKKAELPVYPIDDSFIEAVDRLPDCAGIALGVDRLVQVLLGCQNIDDVLPLPASKLF